MVSKVAAATILGCLLVIQPAECQSRISAPRSVAVARGGVAPVATAPLQSPGARPALREHAPPTGGWRRTAHGWQHTSQWRHAAAAGASAPPRIPCRLHPLVVASLVLLLSLGALVLGDARGSAAPHEADPPQKSRRPCTAAGPDRH